MDLELEREVWRRANATCEYCQMPQVFYRSRFQIDHIIARQHGGATTLDNLALSCFRCNVYKGPNIASLDPVTGSLTRLFHPRRDDWQEHFTWQGAELLGQTAVGRATIAILAINHPDVVAVRRSLIAEGVFP
jgi:hypothetical protein